MKIDIHTHIMPANTPHWAKKFGYGDFIHLEQRNCKACMIKGDKVFREVENNCFEPSDRKRDMEKTGVTMQVLSPIPVLFNYWARAEDALETSRFFNDHIAETIIKNPKEFMGLGTVPMQDIDLAIQEMTRCIEELNLPGIEIGTNVNSVNLSDKKFLPFFEMAEKLNCAIFVHPWQMMGQQDMPDYWLPWLVGMPAETSRAICSLIFSGVIEKFPKLKFAFAHGGGSFPATIGRIDHGFAVRPDLCAIDNNNAPSSYLKKFYIDSLVHDEATLKFIVDVMGEDFICLGSDYPFPLGEHHPGKLISESTIAKEIKDKLLYKNALRWLWKSLPENE